MTRSAKSRVIEACETIGITRLACEGCNVIVCSVWASGIAI